MALISKESIEEVQNKASIEQIIGQYVALKSAGAGKLKGLCPFHSEKTPSFSVDTTKGLYYCFGCGQGGNVLKFLQDFEGLSFMEAVENLAQITGVKLQYLQSNSGDFNQNSKIWGDKNEKTALFTINEQAQDFFYEYLWSPKGTKGVEFLRGRGFTLEQIKEFEIGYAPDDWHELCDHLSQKGWTMQQIQIAGLAKKNQNGSNYHDTFRDRVTLPVKNLSGRVIAFTARVVQESDKNPGKWVNSPNSPIWEKNRDMYLLYESTKFMKETHQVVIVEGALDAIAMHLAGIETAVAPLGTQSFSDKHISKIRSFIGDYEVEATDVHSRIENLNAEMIYVFDGDEAGIKAAQKSFVNEQKFVTQTYVVVIPDGLDPWDYRLKYGDKKLQELVAKHKQTLVNFIIESGLKNLNLETPEGKSAAANYVIPYLEYIKDEILRETYIQSFVNRIGIDRKVFDQKYHTFQSDPNSEKLQTIPISNSSNQDTSYSEPIFDNLDEPFDLYPPELPPEPSMPSPAETIANAKAEVLAQTIVEPQTQVVDSASSENSQNLTQNSTPNSNEQVSQNLPPTSVPQSSNELPQTSISSPINPSDKSIQILYLLLKFPHFYLQLPDQVRDELNQTFKQTSYDSLFSNIVDDLSQNPHQEFEVLVHKLKDSLNDENMVNLLHQISTLQNPEFDFIDDFDNYFLTINQLIKSQKKSLHTQKINEQLSIF